MTCHIRKDVALFENHSGMKMLVSFAFSPYPESLECNSSDAPLLLNKITCTNIVRGKEQSDKKYKELYRQSRNLQFQAAIAVVTSSQVNRISTV